MSGLFEIYLFCAGSGFIFVAGSMLLGLIPHHDHGHVHGHHGHGDADGDFSTTDSADGDFSTTDAGDGHSHSHSGDGGDADFSTADAHQHAGQGRMVNAGHHIRHNVPTADLSAQKTGLSTGGRRRNINYGILLLKLTSPSTIATFAFFFGLGGIVASKYLPVLGSFSVIPATICGVVGYNAMCALSGYVSNKLYQNSSYKIEEIIGHPAEITVPISDGRTGEVVYLKGKVRHTASAKALDGSSNFTRDETVVIADIRDGVVYVERCTDPILHDSISLPNKDLQNS